MARKGVSAAEKRTRMLEIFWENVCCFLPLSLFSPLSHSLSLSFFQKLPFSLKELEKIAPAKKGIGMCRMRRMGMDAWISCSLFFFFAAVSQSVKDVLAELESDGLILKDKLGSGVFYWSFPSVAAQTVCLFMFLSSLSLILALLLCSAKSSSKNSKRWWTRSKKKSSHSESDAPS